MPTFSAPRILIIYLVDSGREVVAKNSYRDICMNVLRGYDILPSDCMRKSTKNSHKFSFLEVNMHMFADRQQFYID